MRNALIALPVLTLVVGCSSMPAGPSVDDADDLQYVTRVEHLARRYGTQVVWINLPQKRTVATQ